MSLEDLYARDIEANYQRRLRTQAAPPETSFSLWSATKALGAGVPAGFAEIAGSGMEGLSVAQQQVQRRPRPVVLRDQPEARFDQVSGEPFRQKVAELAPDPLTAHAADQLLFGLGRFGTKAVAAVASAGPVAGAALLGAEETNTQYRGLLEKGVDPDTALLTATAVGAASAVGVVLPVSGAGLAQTMAGKTAATVGLVAAGGPGLYVAQETAARNLLAGAGYDAEAATHDPSDPLGLALSTILPGGFGAWSLRNAARQARQAKMAAPKTEAQLKEAAALTPEEQAASDAFERSAANIEYLRNAIKAEKNAENRAVLEEELAKQEALAQAAAREPQQPADAETMDAARVVQVDRALTSNLPDAPNARAQVLEAMDAVAAGRFPEIPPAITREERDANFARWFGDSKVVDESGAPLVVYHGTGADVAEFDPAALGRNFRGDYGTGFYFTQNAKDAARYAQSSAGEAPNIVPVHLSLKNPAIIKAAFGDGDLWRMVPGARTADELTQGLIAQGYDGVIVNGGRGGALYVKEAVAFRPEQIKSAIGNSGRFDPTSGSLTDPLDAIPPRSEADNAIPREEDTPAETAAPQQAEPAAPRGRPRDLTAELKQARKSESLLRSLLECLG